YPGRRSCSASSLRMRGSPQMPIMASSRLMLRRGCLSLNARLLARRRCCRRSVLLDRHLVARMRRVREHRVNVFKLTDPAGEGARAVVRLRVAVVEDVVSVAARRVADAERSAGALVRQ